jgi:exodeoxyribonuclease-3
MIDTFRYLHNDEKKFSWWSPLRKANREKNLGWRIDYFLCSKGLESNVNSGEILNDIYGSDHCPILLCLS